MLSNEENLAPDKERKRQSDRVSVELPIEVSGTDITPESFFDRTQTLVVGRHGGKIVLKRKLVVEQELTIRCLTSGREADAEIVGQLGEGPSGFVYGIRLLDPELNLWGIEFPPLDAAEAAVGRVLLECVGCKNREVTHLDEFELEVLEAKGFLRRQCKRCTDTSSWKKSFAEEKEPQAVPPPPKEVKNRRRGIRRALRVTACVHSAQWGEDLVRTNDVSRGGLCFTSSKVYGVGTQIEVAVPHSPGGGNIFLSAVVVRSRSLPNEQTNIYGVAYTFRKE